MEVEIARYPIRCHLCGKTEQVRVVVMETGTEEDERYFSSEGALPTMREAPDGWTWERDADGQPRWICPSCVAHDCGHCKHIRASEQDGALYCQVAGREVCVADQPCAAFARLEDA